MGFQRALLFGGGGQRPHINPFAGLGESPHKNKKCKKGGKFIDKKGLKLLTRRKKILYNCVVVFSFTKL